MHSASYCVKMSGPSTLLLVLMLLLSRVAGDISSSGSAEQSFHAVTVQPTAFSASAPVADTVSDELQRSLRFDPPLLDFGEACPVGTARAHTVTLVNQNANRSVYLTSVSGRTPTFYSSFFEAKVVPPQGNTTFNVVFLPRVHGSVSTDLLIHTSFGQARLQVRGEGRDCPYRLKPLVGIKAPLNATLTPEIQMYNPHNKPLQILEVYSSGGQFQLELPSGGQEGPQTLWEIPPYETKSIIRIRFHARTVGNHTAYIRIKISEQVTGDDADSTSNSGNVLVIPVEIEILPLHGLYADNPVVNFGRLSTVVGHNMKTLQLKLQLHSSHMRQQHILHDYTLRNVPGLTFDPKGGVVILESWLFDSSTILDEVMILRSIPRAPLLENNTQTAHEFTVLIRAEVFKGALHYDANATTFVTQATLGTRGGNKRSLVVRNDFQTPLALLNVSLPQHTEGLALRAQYSSDYLDALASRTSGALVLPRGGSLALLQLQMLNSSMVYKTNLLIRTNITHIVVPLVVCGGRLHVSTYDTARLQADAPYKVDLNLGAIPLAETSHNGYIVLRNRNPLPVKLNNWNFKSPQGVYFHTTFRGCLRPDSLRLLRNATLKLESAKFKLCTQLEQDDVAVFQVTIQSYITEQHQCTLKIWTTYEEITTTVRFRTWIGKLEVDQEKLYFKNCFPGKHCSAELAIRSTFQHPIHITSINFTDAGLRFEDYNVNGSIIEGNAMSKVGRIHFEPALLCLQRCYIPQDERTNMIAFPAPQNTRGGLNNNLHFDETELRRRTELFRRLKYDFQNIAFTLNSNEVRQFLLQLIIDIEWPKFVTGKQVLPTIEVNKPQEVQVLLRNPADTPVLLDYFLSAPTFAKETHLSLPLEVVDIAPHCYLTDKDVFSLPGGAPLKPVLLPPHTSLPVTISFEAPSADTYCTLLHIRNNLTLYEAVWLSAKVVHSQFRLGNRKPGSKATLVFDLTEKHFSVCNQSPIHQQGSNDRNELGVRKYPKVVLKRTFTARNTGEIPIWIETFQIGNHMCTGYGFSISDCSSFPLKANETKKIEIVFTPDYTMPNVLIPLKIHTNLSYNVEYRLEARLLPSTLELCSALIPRPDWEERIRNAAIVLLATTFVFVLIAASIDFDNILLSQTALYEARDKGSVHPTFNLRNIALKAQVATNAVDDEQQQQQHIDSATHAQPPRRGGMQQQHQQHPKVSTSSSSSSSGSNGSGGNSNSGVKKRTLKRQNNVNSNATTNRASLPWSLDLNAFKSNVTLIKNASENDKSSLSSGTSGMQQPAGGESVGKKSTTTTSTIPKAQTHNDKVNRGGGDVISTTLTMATSSPNNANVAGKKQQQTQSPATQPQELTSPQQQARGARKAKNVGGASVAATEKNDKETASGHQKPQVCTGKNARGNTNKANANETLSAIANVRDTGVACSTASMHSPPAKEAGAQSSSKYGKTPGRERRKDAQSGNSGNNGNDATPSNCSSSSTNSGGSSASRRAERRCRQRAAAALRSLNFNDAPTTAAPTIAPVTRPRTTSGKDSSGNAASVMGGLLSCLSTPWDTGNQATFSDVLQAQPITALGKSMPKSSDPSNVVMADSRSAFPFVDKEKRAVEHESDFGVQPQEQLQSAQPKQPQQVVGQNSIGMGLEKAPSLNSTELGPIGSKKSPSSTPVWEPVNSSSSSSGSSSHGGNGLQIPKPIVSTGNCSFFSNLLTTYEYDGNRQLSGIDADPYEMKKAQDEYFEYMYNLRQQQLQAQVQAHVQAQVQAQQQQQQQQLLQGVDWARLNSRTWSPMAAYLGQHDSPGVSGSGGALAAAVNSATASAGLVSSLSAPMAGGGSATASAWPPIGGAATSAGGAVNSSGGVSSTVIRPPPGLESNFQGISNNTQSTAQQQQKQQPLNVLANDADAAISAEMQTFDPFSSLSSIWSDSWQKRNNSNNSNNNNTGGGNMN
ncbi:transmembrane protein 131 homolog [Anastrepha ludens]|uniref:transmembrane protein 131 homolog n=1 Tax=Anastrepha ludens TaxID=28586 RepID=UPI0023AFE5CD|nr:transmembrane protein 131 homolog [Anastrepha ludens]